MTENSRVRILVVGVIALSLFGALVARMWYLQVIEGQRYSVVAEDNRLRIVPREPPRGRILDRRGRVLVENRISNVVSVSRSLVADEREEVLGTLSRILDTPVKVLARRLDDRRFADFRPVPVATEVPEDAMVAIRERLDELPGVDARQAPIRRYRHRELGAHVLGYVGEINDQELSELRHRGYGLGDTVGKTGVERAYESDLRGVPGWESFEVDRRGEVLRSLGEHQPQQGNDVQLTLDLDIQRSAEDALRAHVERVREEGKTAPGGAVVALDAATGGVVAMASFPTFDPTGFVHGIRTAVWEQLNDPANHLPLNNRAVQGQYAPGSTFKLISGIAGITSGVNTMDETILDRGSIEIGDRVFRNAGSKPHGYVALARAITVSSDVYFYKLGFDINARHGETSREIQRIARLFGFGEESGIELPFEQEGRVPDPDWKRKVHQANPQAFPEGNWFAGDNVNLAIGQGDLLVTPLQLANAYAVLANGGTVYQPHLGTRVVDRFGSIVREFPSEARRKVPLAPELRDTIMAGMRGVVAAEDGTAHAAFAGYSGPPVAGKTGTAQVRGKDDSSLFVGMVPADNPRYVVAAIAEEAGDGSAVAAPIVRQVIETVNDTEADPELPPVGTLNAPTPGPDPAEAPTAPPTTGTAVTTVPPPPPSELTTTVPTTPPAAPPPEPVTTPTTLPTAPPAQAANPGGRDE